MQAGAGVQGKTIQYIRSIHAGRCVRRLQHTPVPVGDEASTSLWYVMHGERSLGEGFEIKNEVFERRGSSQRVSLGFVNLLPFSQENPDPPVGHVTPLGRKIVPRYRRYTAASQNDLDFKVPLSTSHLLAPSPGTSRPTVQQNFSFREPGQVTIHHSITSLMGRPFYDKYFVE